MTIVDLGSGFMTGSSSDGQFAELGSPREKDDPDDVEAETTWTAPAFGSVERALFSGVSV
ncbi:MAG: hypothetical protein ABS99_09785 [Acetobacteraceae bacterium SCN 69-10]|nr:MAG: hypothetical protein ABS99_09785 [Acetobacteraceae bacterium SCN 69-10]